MNHDETPKNNTHSNDHTICNKKTHVYSRVVGYIRPVDHWNEGKKEEFEQRTEYTPENS